jgi:hypothetical protein
MMPGFTATAALERSIPTYQAAESNCASDRAGEVRPALPRQGGGGGGSYSRCYATCISGQYLTDAQCDTVCACIANSNGTYGAILKCVVRAMGLLP